MSAVYDVKFFVSVFVRTADGVFEGVFEARGDMCFSDCPPAGMQYRGPVKGRYATVTDVYMIDSPYRGTLGKAATSYCVTLVSYSFNLLELEGQYPNIEYTAFAQFFKWLLIDRGLALYSGPAMDIVPSSPIKSFKGFLKVCNEDWCKRVIALLISSQAATPPKSP
jgi:hypothetical protein